MIEMIGVGNNDSHIIYIHMMCSLWRLLWWWVRDWNNSGTL